MFEQGNKAWEITHARHAAVLLALLAGCAAPTGEEETVEASSAALGETATVSPVDQQPGSHEHASDDASWRMSEVLRNADFVGAVEVLSTTGREGTQGTEQAPAIWTDIQFGVTRVVKDSRGIAKDGSLDLSFLGGRVGTREMRVDHFPTFEEGERVILIVKSDERACPTFSGEYGVLRIKNGRVFTSFGHPLAGITDHGYDVRTPPELVGALEAPKPISGEAGGHLLLPKEGTEHDAMTVEAALAALAKLEGTAR